MSSPASSSPSAVKHAGDWTQGRHSAGLEFRAIRVSGVFGAKTLAGTKAGGSPRAHVAVLSAPLERRRRRRGHARNHRRSSGQRATARRCCWSSVSTLSLTEIEVPATPGMQLPARAGRPGVHRRIAWLSGLLAKFVDRLIGHGRAEVVRSADRGAPSGRWRSSRVTFS
jgi:hypothetical protein